MKPPTPAMIRLDQLREAEQAGYYCLLEALHRLGLGPAKITDTERTLAFMAGVRERLSELSELCREEQQKELHQP